MDESCLLDAVNKSRKLKIRFHISKYDPPDHLAYMGWALTDALDIEGDPAWRYLLGPQDYLYGPFFLGWPGGPAAPAAPRPTEREYVKRDRFLSRPLVVYSGETFPNLHLIKHVAHVEGAVHTGTPVGPREKALDEITNYIRFRDLPPGVYALRAVGRVTYRALKKLETAVGVPGYGRIHYRIDVGPPQLPG